MIHERPYRLFEAALARKVLLTPWMARLTFHGEDIARMATGAPDQRVKILLPHTDGSLPDFPDQPDAYALYRGLPPERRGAIRTYTIRHLRAGAKEVDIDFVLHGDNGPASRWATHAVPGDAVKILAPNRAFAGDVGGYEWRPPHGARRILLVADETALPALAGILDDLASWPILPSVQAFIDAPSDGAAMVRAAWPGLDLAWLREDAAEAPACANRMLAAVRHAWLPEPAAARAEPALETVDIDRQFLWDRAEPAETDFYA
jgi:NADPH-dependent ferric siderophore reductase